MSGRRCRALAAAFEARHGRGPNRTTWDEGKGGHYRSEWRKLKKGAARHEASAAPERLLAQSTAADARRYRKGETRRRRRADRLVAA